MIEKLWQLIRPAKSTMSELGPLMSLVYNVFHLTGISE
jgi:hypothetical protein